MWPNRTAHTDTVSRGRGKKEEEGAPPVAGSLPFSGSALIARPLAFHAENFRVTTRDRVSNPETDGSSSKMNPLCGDLA